MPSPHESAKASSHQRPGLVGFKGPMLHRAWGAGLRQVSDNLHGLLNPVAGRPGAPSTPNPYAFGAPEDTLETYPPGHGFHFELTLFGVACELVNVCIEAALHMASRGWGETRGRFTITSVSQFIPGQGWSPLLDVEAHAWQDQPRIQAPADLEVPDLGQEVTVRFASPLELQEQAGSLRQAPSFAQLIKAITARAQQLATNYQGELMLDREEKAKLRDLSQSVQLVQSDTNWIVIDDSGPRSSRTYRGLTGYADYQGDLATFLPWLALAEIIHIGKKTSYGFGRIQIGE